MKAYQKKKKKLCKRVTEQSWEKKVLTLYEAAGQNVVKP